MKEDFHVDMSGKIEKLVDIGIACVGSISKINAGCAIKGNMLKKIKKELFCGNKFKERAKVYAICIALVLKANKFEVNRLIICNDEDFRFVKKYLLGLLGNSMKGIEIINISEFRKVLGRKINSPADNFARCYRKRGFSYTKRNYGKDINVVKITYHQFKEIWHKIKKE